jgi:hypothetical protein
MSPPPTRRPPPFADDAEHLRASLEWLDALLSARVARVRAAIADKYGCLVTMEYAADLIAFVDSMKQGPKADA